MGQHNYDTTFSNLTHQKSAKDRSDSSFNEFVILLTSQQNYDVTFSNLTHQKSAKEGAAHQLR